MWGGQDSRPRHETQSEGVDQEAWLFEEEKEEEEVTGGGKGNSGEQQWSNN